jgi:hypothetical protein
MIIYFKTDNSGFICQRGQCTLEIELPKGNVYKFNAPIEATHYIDGKFSTVQDVEQLKFKALQQRLNLLLSSDWTQLADVNVDKEAWAEYRQHLRDVPAQAGFPITIDWGVPPQGE